jgi:hypothetical protein
VITSKVMCSYYKGKPHKSGMHYLLPTRAPQEKGAGRRSRAKLPPQQQRSQRSRCHGLRRRRGCGTFGAKKRMFPMFPQLPDQAVLSGKDVNDILAVAFIGDPSIKKPLNMYFSCEDIESTTYILSCTSY